MKEQAKRLAVFSGIASAAAFYFLNRLHLCFENATGNVLERTSTALNTLLPSIREKTFLISVNDGAILMGLCGVALVWLIYLYNVFGAKNYRRGEEHGSAHWGTPADIKPLTNPIPDLNIPLSDTEKISVDKVTDFEADRNKNILLIGGPGSGKTYSEFKPSLMQLHSSYVITDPKGTILPDTGHMLADAGYEIRVFNTVDFSKSLHYNPLAYIRKESDILKVVNVLIENTTSEKHSGDDFWPKGEKLLYTALIGYMIETLPAEEINITSLLKLLSLCEARDGDDGYQSPMDILMEKLAEEKPECLAVASYHDLKSGAAKSLQSIFLSCAARMAPFHIAELREVMDRDELELDEIGERKTAFFVIMSDTDSTYAFLIAMIMYQMFNLLCEKADNEYIDQGAKLPVQVRCLFDEFANIGKIPDFHRLITTIRSRNISCMMGLQSIAQLKGVYKDFADIIIDGCDTMVFLGGKSTATTKQITEMIGKQTVDTQNINESRGQTGSYSMQNNTLGRDLLDPAEIGKISRTECIVLITGLPPFRSKKYRTDKHKRFHEISDGGAPLFDIRQYRQNNEGAYLKGVKTVYEVELPEIDSLF